MQDTPEPRNERHTLMLTASEVNDAKLVAALHNSTVGIVLREWAMKDIRSEAETLRVRLAEDRAASPESAVA